MSNNVDALLLMTDIESDSMLLNFFCSVAFHTVGIFSLATICNNHQMMSQDDEGLSLTMRTK
jgi:hypothetical protein